MLVLFRDRLSPRATAEFFSLRICRLTAVVTNLISRSLIFLFTTLWRICSFPENPFMSMYIHICNLTLKANLLTELNTTTINTQVSPLCISSLCDIFSRIRWIFSFIYSHFTHLSRDSFAHGCTRFRRLDSTEQLTESFLLASWRRLGFPLKSHVREVGQKVIQLVYLLDRRTSSELFTQTV